MGYRKSGRVRPSIRTIRTKTGTKTINVRGSFRKGGTTNPRRRS